MKYEANFLQAMKWLFEGKKVRRKWWASDCYIVMSKIEDEFFVFFGCLDDNPFSEIPYIIHSDDMIDENSGTFSSDNFTHHDGKYTSDWGIFKNE